jgi:hypothetical protein
MTAINRHALWAALVAAALGTAAHGRVTRIVIDERVAEPPTAGAAAASAYEQIAGRAFGELDPKLPGNAIIQDIELAKDADGKVRYVASFVIYRPVDASKASGLMWHDVPNRGRVFPFAPQERASGDIMLASAWQGDNAGATAVRPTASAAGMQFLQLPVARGPGGGAITGEVFARIVNRSGPSSQPFAGADQPGAVSAADARHQGVQAGVARRRNPARRGQRRGGDYSVGLGLGAL